MRITFPHMGNIWLAVKSTFETLGIDPVIPPPNSQRTLSLGVRYSPEMVCLPFKLTLGNMIEALELGADTIIVMGVYGPCRFGYYHRIQEPILREMGYDFEMVRESVGFRGMVKYLTNGMPLPKVMKALIFGLNKLRALHEVEKLALKIRAIERDKGSATRVCVQATEAIDNASDYRAVGRAKREHLQKLMNLPTVPSPDPLKIGVTGEFYIVLDPFANMDVEIELGKLGVEVQRVHSIWESVNFNPFLTAFGLREKDKSRKAAIPYLSRHIGGDGWQSIGEKVLHAREWDGLVHIEPFGCLPETMARNIMPSTKEELPVLNLIFDEHTGRAGVINRLEAFVDMIRRSKSNRRKPNGRS